MTNSVIQTSFNAGEWSPQLNARVDLEKYHAGAALIRNFFVDYRGGATTRPGTRYIAPCRQYGSQVRLIPFQASFTVSYVLEFSSGALRFYSNGAPILETAKTITSAASGPPETFTSAAHGYANGDTLQIAGGFYLVSGVTTNTFNLSDIFNQALTTNPFTLPIAAQRLYTISSPYQASELSAIKFVQNVNQMYITHPNYPPYILTLNSAANWTLAPITFGSTVATPTGLSASSTLGAGNVFYAYIVTAVDVNGQESGPSAFATLSSLLDIRSTGGTNTISWSAVAGASSYNVYRANPRYGSAVPSGSDFGFQGNVTSTTFIDSNIIPDFSTSSPIPQNPFFGSGVQTITLTNAGSISGGTAVPSVSFSGGGGSGAQAHATAKLNSISITNGGLGFNVGQIIGPISGNVYLQVSSVTASPSGIGPITGIVIINPGSLISGNIAPAASGPVNGQTGGVGAQFNFNSWILSGVGVDSPGSGFASAPTVVFSGSTGAAATAVLGAPSAGNPTVPCLIQQRLGLLGPVQSPSQMNFSQPGSPFNFNTTFPTQADNAIQATLTNTILNSIKSAIPVSAGLIVFADKAAWLLNGGSPGSPISALSLVANVQGYSGAADLPPITTPTDILYVQSKGSIVRDLAFNFYLNNYVGTDISILSAHLFYGFQLLEWAWAEEPFKTVWAVRSDGQLLSLCFVKDQQMIAWAHSDTLGAFKSICTVTESSSVGSVDAIYHVVQRTINGQTVQYVERFVELNYPSGFLSSWQVDAGIGYNATPATTFSGAQHLSGQAVTGVADGVVINFTMPASGTFVFGPGGTPGLTDIASASIVTVGLAFLPQLQTLALDLGQPTVQGKRKKISAVTVRVDNALGLSIGRSFDTLVPMNDLVLGQVGSASNALVTDLQTCDARTIVDPQWDVPGQYCLQQNNPYPASVLGLIPEIIMGDTP
jgi:hypothetical protein